MAAEPDLGRRTIAALGWSYGGAFVRAGAQLLIQMVLARLLGPVAYGQAMLVLAMLGLGWLLAESGFGSALVQKAELYERDIRLAVGWVLLFGSAISILMLAGATPLAKLLGQPEIATMIRVAAPFVLIQALSNVPASLLRRQLDLRRQQLIQTGTYIFGFGVVAMTLAAMDYGPWSIVWGYLVQVSAALVLTYSVVRHPVVPRLRGDPAVRRFGLAVLGTNLANWSIENLDRILIGRYWGPGGLGAYAISVNLSRAPASMLVNAAQGVVFSAASRVQHDQHLIGVALIAALNVVTAFTFPLFMVMALTAEPLVHTLFGNAWDQAASVLPALCAAIPFYAMLAVAGPILGALGAASTEMRIQWIVVVLMAIGLWSVSSLPLHAAVWVVPLVYFLRAGAVVMAIRARIDLRLRRIFAAALAGVAVAGAYAAAAGLARLGFQGGEHHAWFTVAVGSLVAVMMLMGLRQRLFTRELLQTLQAAAARSRLLYRLCTWLRADQVERAL